MAKIHAGISELKAAHNRLAAASGKGTGESGNLLLFYAAECGLKCAYLRGNGLRTTEQLENTNHDLNWLIKALKLPATTLGGPPTLRLSRHNIEVCSHSDAHQAWRYGVRIESADEEKFVDWLHSICQVVKERL